MQEAACKKSYVAVNLDVDENGVIYPRAIRWRSGLVYQIDRILYKCRATSDKVPGGGIRYTVRIKGQESFLFREGEKWFVEEKSR